MKRILFALVALIGLLSSCGGGKTNEQAGDVLRIGVMPSIDHLPMAIALERGYYDSLGLQLELVRFSSPMERDAALQAGEIDGTVSDYTTVMLQHQKGLPVQLLFALDGTFAFVANPSAGVASVADLRGKRVGLSSNTVIEYATDKLVAEAGMAATDVEKVEVQKIPLRLEMLAKGELDAAVLPQPFAQIALDRGLSHIPGVLGVGAGQLHVTALALNADKLRGREATLLKLIAGYNKAADFLNGQPISEWSAVAARELKVDEEVVNRMSFGLFAHATAPAASDIEAVAKWLQTKGLIPASYTGQEAIMPMPTAK